MGKIGGGGEDEREAEGVPTSRWDRDTQRAEWKAGGTWQDQAVQKEQPSGAERRMPPSRKKRAGQELVRLRGMGEAMALLWAVLATLLASRRLVLKGCVTPVCRQQASHTSCNLCTSGLIFWRVSEVFHSCFALATRNLV